ncbi:MAG: PIN domain-containing protein [Acidobacteriia bacterium]|nr:PIN domain-containing protein [Terriglobia bacterium]
MTVYVESNFVLEQSLEQEEGESCAEVIELASNGRITLAVPAFSLAEPHVAIMGKEKARSRLSNDLRRHLFELGRSKQHREVPATFEALASVLIASAQIEREGLRSTISELLRTADVIALDAAILRSAAAIEVEYGMSGQDAIVLASVLAHIEVHNPLESCFLNRNSKDFDDPDIRERLDARGCKFFSNFGDGLRYILSRIEKN